MSFPCLGSFCFSSIINLALFHALWNSPSVRYLLKTCRKYSLSFNAGFLITSFGVPSGPGAFPVLSLLHACLNPPIKKGVTCTDHVCLHRISSSSGKTFLASVIRSSSVLFNFACSLNFLRATLYAPPRMSSSSFSTSLFLWILKLIY